MLQRTMMMMMMMMMAAKIIAVEKQKNWQMIKIHLLHFVQVVREAALNSFKFALYEFSASK